LEAFAGRESVDRVQEKEEEEEVVRRRIRPPPLRPPPSRHPPMVSCSVREEVVTLVRLSGRRSSPVGSQPPVWKRR
jgi:hypothetical protein